MPIRVVLVALVATWANLLPAQSPLETGAKKGQEGAQSTALGGSSTAGLQIVVPTVGRFFRITQGEGMPEESALGGNAQ